MNILASLSFRAATIVSAAESASRKLEVGGWLVGGTVRDLLLERAHGVVSDAPLDVDLAFTGRIDEIAKLLADELHGAITHHPNFLTATVHLEDTAVDLTTTRRETYPRPGALPVVSKAGIEEDLARRDFTINAIAVNLRTSELIDPCEGREDIRARVIRILHPASFRDDPTRIDRAARFAARLGFEIEPETLELAKTVSRRGGRADLSSHRLWTEFQLVLQENTANRALELMGSIGALREPWGIADELPQPIAEAIARAMDPKIRRESREAVVAGLLAGAGNSHALGGLPLPAVRRDLLSRIAREAPSVRDTLRHASRDQSLRLAIELPEELFTAAALLGEDSERLLAGAAHARSVTLPFTGAEISDQPGPHIGRALLDARVAVASGKITVEDAEVFARNAAVRYLRSQ